MTPLPLRQLNAMTTLQNALLMLRAMNTSDLGWFYMCFKDDTVRDVVATVRDFLAMIPADETGLNEDELEELQGYLTNMTEGL